MKALISISIIGIIAIIGIIIWQKIINPDTTWIYAINCVWILMLISLYSLCTIQN